MVSFQAGLIGYTKVFKKGKANMSIDHRRYPRVSTSEATIYFSKQGGDSERIHYMGTITNTSQGGIGMQVNFPHQSDDLLWIEGLDGHSNAQVSTVKWVKDIDSESFEIGLQFKA